MGMFVKLPEYKRFNMKPRYWNPEEEARKEREKRVRAELGLDENGKEYIPDVRAGLRREYDKRKASRAGNRMSSSYRFFIVLIILLLIGFYLVTYKLEAILNLF